ncbi:hypothetical protein [Rhizobium laguerreae]|uniref:hypothetical protein n=1 Tax=Rhizobium laguerreae TaxID=1076926 RepID=UPI001C91688C|nr:hypothetical protein [Rhizobium laguerreae]MBY3231946.1 hypothetical protein [Rhizobium laguerreae]
MSKVRVAGAIASQNGITFYLENGEEMNLVKDSARTRMILDATVEALARKEIVEIDLESFSVERRIEQQTNGLVRFFKTTVSKFVGREVEKPYTTEVIGQMDKPVRAAPRQPEPTPAPKPDKLVRDTLRDERGDLLKDDDVITVAVVQTPAGEKMVPNVQGLEKQMEYAAFENVAGFQKFMERLANVDRKFGHSVQELINFMKRGDLPIAEDGCIVAYKMLYAEGGEVFTDPHTRKVRQRVGAHVSMPVDRVDPNRRTACSTGLHIARRAYVKSFHGDTIMLVKIKPEDVIAVPYGEPDKMRVAGYHIVGKLPAEGAALVRANKPMTTDSESAQMLANVIAGHHTPITEYVVIGAAKGENVTTKPAARTAFSTVPVSSAKLVHALDSSENGNVSIKDLRVRADKAIVDQRAAQKAAQSGDLAAAISQPATPAPAPVVTPESAKVIVASAVARVVDEKLKAAPKKVALTGAARVSAALQKEAEVKAAAEKPLPAKHAAALKLHGEGKSNRQIEAELHICRKTLKKLFDKNGLKPNG